MIVLCDSKDKERVASLRSKCLDGGFRVVLAPSLYDIPEKSPWWGQLSGLGRISAIWSTLHPRPAKWLLHRHGLETDTFRYDAYASVQACFEAMRLGADEESRPAGSAVPADVLQPDGDGNSWKVRWHPIVDKDLCDNCGQCLQFCLFSVYTRDEAQNVTVGNPDACKTGCPACSRICPKGAIIFPLYSQDPAISGAPGFRMAPDKSARRMFYLRTKQACPICKVIPSGSVSGRGATCPECGSAYEPPKSAIQDDIDFLIDALDGRDNPQA
jgi:Pyruvate/2-oxoacid:ferredoxin oxidoreductase delta subunit